MTWAGRESNVSSLAHMTVMEPEARADESVPQGLYTAIMYDMFRRYKQGPVLAATVIGATVPDYL